MALQIARIFRPLVLCLTFSLLSVSGAAGVDESQRARMNELQKKMDQVEREIDQLYRRVPLCDEIEDEPMMRLWVTKGVELETFDLKTVGDSERLRLEDGRPVNVMMRRLESPDAICTAGSISS